MKKRDFRQFLKENLGWLALVFWLFLISATITFIIEDSSIWIKISLITVSVIYTVAGIKMMCKSFDKEEKQKAEAKEKKLRKLEKQYKYYIDLVNHQVQKTLNQFKDKSLYAFCIDTSLEYLISFENNKDWICKTRIVGKPDIFIIASCLMYSIIDHPIITTKGTEDIAKLEDIKFSINLDIAMNCALQIISEPITYYEDSMGFWVEEKHSKVNIVVPNGLIKNSELYQRIINTIYHDDLADNRTSIMQFSNLLHLIYLNCR